MASLYSKLMILFPDANIDVNDGPDWVLCDARDGKGAYVEEWNRPEPQPTEEQLEAVDSDANNWEAIQIVRKQRKRAYPDMRDQLDQIFHEGIDAWKETIQAVKDAHPKPE